MNAPESSRRTCEECTLCCFTHGVSGSEGEDFLHKPEDEWCRHSGIGTGCAIYESRPKVCRDFHCGWLIGLGSEEDRPDKTNVVIQRFSIYIGQGASAMVVKMVEAVPHSIAAASIQAIIAAQVEKRDLVELSFCDGTRELRVRKGVYVPYDILDHCKKKNIPVIRVGS